MQNNGLDLIKSNYEKILVNDNLSYLPIVNNSKNVYIENEYIEDEYGRDYFNKYIYTVINEGSGTFCTAHHNPIALRYQEDGSQYNEIAKGSIPLKYLKNKSEYISPIEKNISEENPFTRFYTDPNPLANTINYNFHRFFNVEYIGTTYKSDKFDTVNYTALKEIIGKEVEKIKVPDILIDMLNNCMSDNGLTTNKTNFAQRYEKPVMPRSVEKYTNKPIIYTNSTSVMHPNEYNYNAFNLNNALLCTVRRLPLYDGNKFKITRSYFNYDQLKNGYNEPERNDIYLDFKRKSTFFSVTYRGIDSDVLYYTKPLIVDNNYKNTTIERKNELIEFENTQYGFLEEKYNIPEAITDLLNKCNDDNAFEALANDKNAPKNLFNFDITFPQISSIKSNIVFIKDVKYKNDYYIKDEENSISYGIIDKSSGVTCNVNNDLRKNDPIYKNEGIYKGVIPKKYLAPKFTSKIKNIFENDKLMDYFDLSEAYPYIQDFKLKFDLYAETFNYIKSDAKNEFFEFTTTYKNIAGFIIAENQIPKTQLDKLNLCMKPNGMNEIRMTVDKSSFSEYKPSLIAKLEKKSEIDPNTRGIMTYDKGIQKMSIEINESSAVKFEYEISSEIENITKVLTPKGSTRNLTNGSFIDSAFFEPLKCGGLKYFIKIRLINANGIFSDWSKNESVISRFCYVKPKIEFTNYYDKAKYKEDAANDQIIGLKISGEPFSTVEIESTQIKYGTYESKVKLDKNGVYNKPDFYKVTCDEIGKLIVVKVITYSPNLVKTEPVEGYINAKDCAYNDLNLSKLEQPILIKNDEAEGKERLNLKTNVEYSTNKNTFAFLRFIDNKDREKFTNGYTGNKDVYIVTHGYADKILYFGQANQKVLPESGIAQNGFTSIAKTIKRENPDAVVLVLDWSNLAYGKAPGELGCKWIGTSFTGLNFECGAGASDLNKAASYINPTAKEVIKRLREWGLNNNDNINVVGHSLGTLMAHEIGRESGSKINRMILMDPASDLTQISRKNSLITNKAKKLFVNSFQDFSKYSIALVGRQSVAGNEGLAKSALESYWNSIDDIDIAAPAIHTYTISTMLALSNNEKLKLKSNPVLTVNDYNLTSYNLRKFPRDDLPSKNQNSPGCFINPFKGLDCTKSYKNIVFSELNDWRNLPWDGHNGVVVSKKLPENVSAGSRTYTKGEIQNGFVIIVDTTTKVKRKIQLDIK